MKYLIPILTLLWLLLLTCAANNMAKELSDLKARDRLRSMEIMALRAKIQLNDKNAERVIAKAEWVVDEVRAIVNVTYSRFIPIDGGWLAIREEE